MVQHTDEKEAAYFYDLVIVPQWRERFDNLVDDSLKFPEKGRWAELGCGTGAYAVEMAVRGGKDVQVVGIEANETMRQIAQGKAEMQKVQRVQFQAGTLAQSGLDDACCALVLSDASNCAPQELAGILQEAARIADKGGVLALKLTTHGSFDEFFSILWETLYELDLLEYTGQIESLTSARFTVSGLEALAKEAKLKQCKTETRKEIFAFEDGKTFLNDPLAQLWLKDWLSFLPAGAVHSKVENKLVEVIDRARDDMPFEVSIKATLMTAEK